MFFTICFLPVGLSVDSIHCFVISRKNASLSASLLSLQEALAEKVYTANVAITRVKFTST